MIKTKLSLLLLLSWWYITISYIYLNTSKTAAEYNIIEALMIITTLIFASFTLYSIIKLIFELIVKSLNTAV